MWHVEGVRDVILIFYECNAIYVNDVKDRSNTPKDCNAMYVEDVEDWKRTYIHILLITFLIFNRFSIQKIFLKAETQSISTILSNTGYIKACQRCQR